MTEKRELDPLSVAIGKNIVDRRLEINMTASELHRATKITRSALNNYEKGRHQPRAAELIKVCDALECSPNRLLTGTDELRTDRSLGVSFVDTGDDRKNILRTVFAIMVLRKADRDAVMRLVASLIEGNKGQGDLVALGRFVDLLIDEMGPILEQMEADIEATDWSAVERQLQSEGREAITLQLLDAATESQEK